MFIDARTRQVFQFLQERNDADGSEIALLKELGYLFSAGFYRHFTSDGVKNRSFQVPIMLDAVTPIR